VLGDSYSKGAAIALNEAYPEAKITLKHLGGCKPLIGDNSEKWLKDIGGKKPECEAFVDAVFKLDFTQYDAITLSLRWANRHLKYVEKTTTFLSNKTDSFIVLGPRIVMRKKASDLLGASNSLTEFANNSNAAVYRKQYNWVNTNLKSILQSKPVTYIDIGNLQGGTSFNNLTTTGSIYVYDDGHLTLEGAKDLGLKIRQLYPNLFTN